MIIAYAINGEGMGHASRSSVIIDYLIERGHTVYIFASGNRQASFLRDKFSHVTEVTGFPIIYEENAVRRMKTAAKAINNLTDIRIDIKKVRKVFDGMQPDVVITDFDPHGQLIARLYDVPIISIDNIQYLRFVDLETRAKDFVDYELNVFVARMMVPRADHYFVTTFDPVRVNTTSDDGFVDFVAPVLRKKILSQVPSHGDHILVYQTSDSYSELIPLLARSKERYILYNCKERMSSPNISYRRFDEDAFITDLASAKAVITNGGFTLISEALYYHKPILSVPVAHHYEQKLNGLLLESSGFGMMVERLSAASLTAFLRNLESFSAKKDRISFDATVLFDRLDRTMQVSVG